MKVTVQYLISQPYLDSATVLCCQNKLSNQVEGVNFMETPSENMTLLKNTLIIIGNGALERLTHHELSTLMDIYKNTRVSALCIRESADPAMLELLLNEARSRDIPVLLLPKDSIASTIISGITHEILYANGYNFTASYETNFLQEIIFTEQDPQMMVKRARMIGIRVNEYLCVILIRPSRPVDMAELTQQCKLAWGASSFANSKNGSVMLIGRLTGQYALVNQTFQEMAEAMQHKLRQKYGGLDICVGVGHCFENIINLRKSYYSAKVALITAVSNTFQRDLVIYDGLGIFKILFDIRNRESISAIRDDTVARIQAYDREHSTDFYNTISAYLDNFFSVQDTAKALFVHYNTIRYRISKIKDIFGWNLFSLEDCIYLAISMRIDRFLIDEDAF